MAINTVIKFVTEKKNGFICQPLSMYARINCQLCLSDLIFIKACTVDTDNDEERQ